MSGISFARGNTIVSGPGQNAFANLSATSGHAVTQRFAISAPATCTIIGLCAGRPLISKMRDTAFASSAFAARP